MTPEVDWFIRHTCALASLAYASGMKRLGHGYYVSLVAAVWNASDDTEVVYRGPMPRRLRMPVCG
jgi:hypothetical protein